MAKLLIKCVRPYHGVLWPNAKPGDKRWGDEGLMARLARDGAGSHFIIVEVVSDRNEHIQTMRQPEVPPKAEAQAPEAPKRKRGRPKKVVEG